MKPLDITGEKYGKLTAVKRFDGGGRHTYWQFVCDCGTDKAIKLDHVRSGRVVSCGCHRASVTSARSITHGHSIGRKESRELSSYNSAKSRCQNPNDEKYPNYGARGIRMCDAWANDASLFIAYMGPRPIGHTLDRIDTDGHYEPGNCRWATSHQQARNRTDNVVVQYQGLSMILKDYAALMGIDYKRLHARLRKGMSLEAASLP